MQSKSNQPDYRHRQIFQIIYNLRRFCRNIIDRIRRNRSNTIVGFIALLSTLYLIAIFVSIGFWQWGAPWKANIRPDCYFIFCDNDLVSWEVWGQRGDFVGGFLNSVFSFFALMGVLYTVYLQRKDLEVARQDNSAQEGRRVIQSFETVFFSALKIHNDILSTMDVHVKSDPVVTISGRDCFKFFYDQLLLKEFTPRFRQPKPEEVDDIFKFQERYNRLWLKFRKDLGHYFRFLYNLISFIDEFRFSPSDEENEVVKRKYIKILRAQLSDYELALIFYSSLTVEGYNFQRFLSKFDILDNLPPDFVRIG